MKYTGAAERYFKKIKDKNLLLSYKTAINKLMSNPYIGRQKVGDLRGVYGYDVKYAGTNYEIAYRIYEENSRFLVVVLAGARENFYESLKRLIKTTEARSLMND